MDSGAGKTSGGGLNFNRRSTVSPDRAPAEVRLGRDDSATFWNTLIFDPFLTNGVGGTGCSPCWAFRQASTGGAPIQISNVPVSSPPQNLAASTVRQPGIRRAAPAARPTSARATTAARAWLSPGPFNGALATGRFYGKHQRCTNLIYEQRGPVRAGTSARPSPRRCGPGKRGSTKITALQLGVTAPVAMAASACAFRPLSQTPSGSNADWEQDRSGLRLQPPSARWLAHGSPCLPGRTKRAGGEVHRRRLSAPGTTPGGKLQMAPGTGIRHFFWILPSARAGIGLLGVSAVSAAAVLRARQDVRTLADGGAGPGFLSTLAGLNHHERLTRLLRWRARSQARPGIVATCYGTRITISVPTSPIS